MVEKTEARKAKWFASDDLAVHLWNRNKIQFYPTPKLTYLTTQSLMPRPKEEILLDLSKIVFVYVRVWGVFCVFVYKKEGSAPLSQLTSTCNPLGQRLLAAWSSPYQMHDQHLLSCLIRSSQPVDQHLSAALSAPVSRFISTYQLLDQHLSAAWSAHVSSFISTYQLLDQHLSAAW